MHQPRPRRGFAIRLAALTGWRRCAAAAVLGASGRPGAAADSRLAAIADRLSRPDLADRRIASPSRCPGRRLVVRFRPFFRRPLLDLLRFAGRSGAFRLDDPLRRRRIGRAARPVRRPGGLRGAPTDPARGEPGARLRHRLDGAGMGAQLDLHRLPMESRSGRCGCRCCRWSSSSPSPAPTASAC